MIRIGVKQITGLDTLAGKSGGLRDFPKFIAAIDQTPEGSTLILDWSGVEIATASYIGATVAPLLQLAMEGSVDRYFLLAGLNRTCLEDLKLVLESKGLVALHAQIDSKGSIQRVTVLGSLAQPYAETLTALRANKAASASELYDRQTRARGSRIGKTGWINRLANLYRLRLVRKQRSGREFIFQAIG